MNFGRSRGRRSMRDMKPDEIVHVARCPLPVAGHHPLDLLNLNEVRKKGAQCLHRARIKNGVPHLDRFGPVKVFNVVRSAMHAPPTCGTAFLIAVLAVPGKYALHWYESVYTPPERDAAELPLLDV